MLLVSISFQKYLCAHVLTKKKEMLLAEFSKYESVVWVRLRVLNTDFTVLGSNSAARARMFACVRAFALTLPPAKQLTLQQLVNAGSEGQTLFQGCMICSRVHSESASVTHCFY